MLFRFDMGGTSLLAEWYNTVLSEKSAELYGMQDYFNDPFEVAKRDE